MSALIGVFGAAGFAREVMPLIRAQVAGIQEPSPATLVFVDRSAGQSLNGHEVISEDAFFASGDDKSFAIAISDPSTRKSIFGRALASGAAPLMVRARSAEIMDAVEIGDGAILCSHTYIGSNVQIGRGCHLNYFAQIAHDCCVGDFVTLAPRATCNGAVTIGDFAYLGSGCVIRQTRANEATLHIGEGAVVGMGAVVTRSVPPGAVVVGNPARLISSKPD